MMQANIQFLGSTVGACFGFELVKVNHNYPLVNQEMNRKNVQYIYLSILSKCSNPDNYLIIQR